MNYWDDAFARDPKQAVADLFSGRLGLGSSLRLDIPELLYQEFPDSPEFAPARKELDNALFHWLCTMRNDYAAQVKRLGYGVYSKRLCDALISVQLLDLPTTTYHLRETPTSWLNWLTPLRLAPERDPALEYWQVLTHHQRNNASPAPWLQLASDTRREYFKVALVGLQRLPLDNHASRNQHLQLLALLQHAAQLPDSTQASKFFNQQFSALQAIYPTGGSAYWRDLLASTLESFKQQTRVAEELVKKLRPPPPTKGQAKKHVARSVVFQPADKTERDELLKDINTSRQSAEILAQRLFKLLDKDYAYALATGDSYFFIRSLSNRGTRLVKRHQLSVTDLNHLQTQIERGLSLEPMNAFIWMLWAECLAGLNRVDAQEWVLREAVRLFPNNEPSRVELARLLMKWFPVVVAKQSKMEDSHSHWVRNNRKRRIVRRKLKLIATSLDNRSVTSDNGILQDSDESERLHNWDISVGNRSHSDAPFIFVIGDNLYLNQQHDNLQFNEYPIATNTGEELHNSTSVNVLTKILAELKRRADLQREFKQACEGVKFELSKIDQAAAQGDALACFYRQWLQADTAPESPPNAWAAHACRCYQNRLEDWQSLNQTFPQYRFLHRFLQLQIQPNDEEAAKLATKLASDSKARTPVEQFMSQALKFNPSQDPDSLALAVLTSCATAAPQFVAC